MHNRKKHIWVLFAFIFLFANSCKHKEKEMELAKKVSTPKKKHGQVSSKKTTKSSTNNTWYQPLGITHKQVKSNSLYSFIDDWYGTPYKYSGCSKSGVDCSCFTNICYEKVYGKKVSRTAYDMFLASDQITIDRAKEGDLVFFKIGGNKISHVGILLRKNYFVHSSTSRGVILNSLDEAYYKKYFFCAAKAN